MQRGETNQSYGVMEFCLGKPTMVTWVRFIGRTTTAKAT